MLKRLNVTRFINWDNVINVKHSTFLGHPILDITTASFKLS